MPLDKKRGNCLTLKINIIKKRRNSIDERNSNLEKLISDEVDKMYQILRKFKSTDDDVRNYFIELEELKDYSDQVYRGHRIKLEEERERYDKEFRKKRNELDEEFQKLRRNYASTNG